jgi:hypothetical protein
MQRGMLLFRQHPLLSVMTISLSAPASAAATPASAAAAARTTAAAGFASAGAGAAAFTPCSRAAGATAAPARLPATSRRFPSGTRARRLRAGRSCPSTLLAAFARGLPRASDLVFFVHQLCLTLRFTAWHDGDLQLECARIKPAKHRDITADAATLLWVGSHVSR